MQSFNHSRQAVGKYDLPLETNSILTVSSDLLHVWRSTKVTHSATLQNQNEVLFLCVDFLVLFEVGCNFSSVISGISPHLPSLQNCGVCSCKDIGQLSWYPQIERIRVPWTCGS